MESVPVSEGRPSPFAAIPAEADPIALVAPGRGFFGALDSDCLDVAVGMPVRSITLRIDDDVPVFLNLSGVELHGEHGPLELEALDHEVRVSSSVKHKGDPAPEGLLRGVGLHTLAETNPWWSIRFTGPVDVGLVRIRNRADVWGLRSRSLQVLAEGADGRQASLYKGGAREAVIASLGRVGRTAMTAGPAAAALASPRSAVAARSTLLHALARRLRAGILPLSATPWRDVVQLLDIWSSGEPGPDEWTVLAGFLLAQHRDRRGTAIKAMARLLCSRARLDRLTHEVDVVTSAYGLARLILTRHGFSPVGKLSSNPDVFLDHLGKVIDVLRSMGRDPVLAYGTLLGAVREGTFISHDDDVDVLYTSPGSDRASVVADLSVVREHLQGLGYRVDSLLPNNLNMHVFHPRTGALMDIFPCWIEGAGLMLHMEGMTVRPIRPDIVHPAGSIELHGRSFPAPADPEAFLEERYGSGWRISDPFFEWPWKLEESDA